MKHTKQSIISKDGVSYLIPFILITSCFALWGFANDITNPMVPLLDLGQTYMVLEKYNIPGG